MATLNAISIDNKRLITLIYSTCAIVLNFLRTIVCWKWIHWHALRAVLRSTNANFHTKYKFNSFRQAKNCSSQLMYFGLDFSFFTEKTTNNYCSAFMISSYDFPFVSGNTRTIKIPHTKHDAAKQNTIVPSPIISVSGSTTLSTKNAAIPKTVLQNEMPNPRIFSGISSAVTL